MAHDMHITTMLKLKKNLSGAHTSVDGLEPAPVVEDLLSAHHVHDVPRYQVLHLFDNKCNINFAVF